MKYYKLLIILLVGLMSISAAYSVNLDESNDDFNLTQIEGDSGHLSYPSPIYVDDVNGDDDNDGSSQQSSFKTFNKSLDKAEDNNTIYIANGVYSGLDNTKITIEKSLNIVGSDNTTFDGLYENYIFLINDGISVTFKNINFINAYKTEPDIDLIDDYEIEGIYGSALDIQNATVTLENCRFIENMANYDNDQIHFTYGGAVSNFGDLTILNSYFYGNAIGATVDVYGYGGALYNKGKVFIGNSSFINCRGSTYSNGGAIYNDGELMMNNSIVSNSYCWEESKGGAIFNNGMFVLLNSIIENNTIERTNFNYIYGNVFNSGTLIASGNVFRNNTGFYKQPNSQYVGGATIYNVGNLNMSYNAFIDNLYFNEVAADVYLNGGNDINIDNNWWQCNENPADLNKVNQHMVDSWIMLDLSPQYSSLKINETIDIIASWKLSSGEEFEPDILPVFKIVLFTIVDGNNISLDYLTNETVKFNFNNTQNKGIYQVTAVINSFETHATVDVGKSLSYINFNINDVTYYNETILLNISLFDDDNNPISDNLTVTLNNRNYPVEIKSGKGNIEFKGILPGNYTLKMNYGGNDIYSKSSNETEICVMKLPIRLTIDEIGNVLTSDIVNLTVRMEGDVEGIAYLYVNGVYKQRIYLNKDNSSFNLANFKEGQYNITVIFPEDSIHESANASVFINVGKASASIKVSCVNITSGEDEIITIEVSPDNFQSEVILCINGVNNTVFLNDRVNNFTVSGLTNGTYDVSVIFNGNDRFFKTNASASFTVFMGKSILEVTVDKTNLTGTVSVNVIPSKCSGLISLYVNQRSYTAYLNKGKANFNVEFDRGTNYIYVVYNGDIFHDGSTWNTSIGEPEEIFIKADNQTSYEHNDFNYTVILYEENGYAVPNRNVTIKFLGEIYALTTDNRGIASLLLNLNTGSYDISATFENKTVLNTITIKEISFSLFCSNITYGETEFMNIVFEDNITGKIRFVLSNGVEAVKEIDGNEVSLNLSDLNAGSYGVEVVYFNDAFNSTAVEGNFNVEKANLALDVDISEFEIEKTGYISVSLPNATGNVTFKIDDTTYERIIDGGTVILAVDGLSEGRHKLSITYFGDNNYNNASFITEFFVKSAKMDLILIVDDAYYGDDLNAIAILDKDATGKVIFNVNGLTGEANVTDGIAIWTFKGLDVGNYRITANYSGDDTFLSSNNETSFNVLKANSTIELYVREVCLEENIRIYASLSPNATGMVSFEMPGYYSPRNKNVVNSSSNWYISPLKSGNYTVIANYSGDKNYYPSNTSFILEVSQRRSILDVVINDVYVDKRVVVNVKLTSDKGMGISGTVILNLNSRTYNIQVTNGKGLLNIGKMTVGEYSFSASYEGNDEFVRSTDDGKFKVVDSLIETNLLTTNVTKHVGSSEKLIASLVDSSGKGISGYDVYISLNNRNYTLVTDENGDVSLDLNLKPGVYSAFVKFNGADSYEGCEANVTIEVLSTIQSSDLTKLYGTGGQYFAIFCDSNGKALANTPVEFTIGSTSYKFNTAPNGVVRLDINLKPGIYTIIAKNPVTGEEARNTINIFTLIMGNKDVTKYYGGSQTYKVRIYNEDGKAAGAGKVVQFKLNGKKYNVKTDKNGYAVCKLNLKPKKYTITATYSGFKVSNKITVKPVLYAKGISVKKAKFIKFKVKLVKTNGKPFKGKKITFKFKGKSYKVKTNKKGFATLKITYKLKVGKYKIVAKYGKSKVSKKISVRR